MISLISEITDRKGRRAAGWVFYDGECEFCRSLARRFRSTLEKRGFGLAPLQDPRVATLLGLAPNLLLQEMRVLTAEGEVLGGAQAVTFLTGKRSEERRVGKEGRAGGAGVHQISGSRG